MKGNANPQQAPPVRSRVFSAALGLFFLAGLVLFAAFLGEGSPAPRQVGKVPDGGKALLFEEWQGLCLLVVAGEGQGTSLVLALDGATGEQAAQAAFSGSRVTWAGLRGGSLFLREDLGGMAFLTQLSLPGLEPLNSWALAPEAWEAPLFDCDGQERVYFSPGDGSLWAGDPGAPALVDAPGLEGLTFLEVTREGTLFAASATLYLWGDGGSPESLAMAPAYAEPFRLLGEDLMVDGAGGLYQYAGGQIAPCPFSLPPSFQLPACALDGEGNLVCRSAQGGAALLSPQGELLGSQQVRGELLAVSGCGALSQEDGAYWYTPLSFAQEEPGGASPSPSATPPAESPTPSPEGSTSPSPTPSPSATPPAESPSPSPEGSTSPSPTPSPGVTPPAESPSPSPEGSTSPSPTPSPSPAPPPTPEGITMEGEFLVMPEGVPLETLLARLGPDAVKVTRPDGTAVTGGRLATGMAAGSWTLVVEGDCDGSGSVNQADVLAAQELLLEGSQVEGSYRRAADLDRDGVLTTQDLVLLSQLAGG